MDSKHDVRKQFLFHATGNFFGLKDIDDSTFKNQEALLNFLNDGTCLTLCAFTFAEASTTGQTIAFDNKVTTNNAEQVLVFFKVQPDIITVENIHSVVFISSIQSNPIKSLYHCIQRVFVPAFLQNGINSSVDPQLQELISQLESGLKSAINRGNESGDTIAGIFSIGDECHYWKDFIHNSTRKRERDQGLAIYNLLKPLEKEILALQGPKALFDVEDMLEMAHGTLDELWHLEETAYPQKRMEHLMQIIGNTLTKVIQEGTQNINIWKSDFNSIEKTLKQSISGAQKWLESCKKLTSIFWPNVSSHQWKGEMCEPIYLKTFLIRLQEILRIRTLHNQLSILLTSQERQDLNTENSLVHFLDINAMQCSPYTEPQWKSAVSQFENLVEPIEEKVSSRLQAKLQQESSHPLQVMQEMQKQGALVSRPNMLRLLTGQREVLLASLTSVIKDSRSELNARQGLQSSSVIDSVTWARQLESKVTDIQTTGKLLLEDLSGFSKHQETTETFLQDLQEFRTDIVDTWTQEMSAAIANHSLGLKMNAPVVQFESSHQLMKVNYDPRLVTLIREARQLTVLGHKIPPQIRNATEQAKKFMRQAKLLEQISTFHNTIGDRMVTSQRPMMLEAALGLAQLVQQEAQVTWSDLRAVDTYLAKLQTAVERLAKQNNLLAAHHDKIRSKVLALMSTDLLRSQGQWKDGVRDIRDIFMQVELQKFTNMKAWRAHWDRQLYKALEFQYQVGLEALSEHLPEMKIELVYRQQQLQFQPPMEEIRSKYFVQLKRFLAIPNLFRGVGDGKEKLIFPTIVERNAHRFGPLFAQAEELFGRLDALKSRFTRWVALGSVDLDLLSQKHLNNAADWDANFRASKAWGQEIARLTCLEEKIECFTISYLPVRAEAEVHNRRYWDVLAGSLQASVARDASDIEKFAKDGMETLRQQPQTVDEIGLASIQHAQLTKEVPEMIAKHEAAFKKNKTLASWTKERVDALDKVAAVWENFQSVLGNHDSLISRQVESIKASLETRKEELLSQTEKFWLRWQQLRPNENKLQEGGSEQLQAVLISLAERRREWDTLQMNRDKLSEEYKQFGLPPVDALNWEEIEKDLISHEATWSLFNEFQTGINEISEEEWIIFRSKSFKFEEFLLLWDQRLQDSSQKGGITPVAAKLLNEIEKYKAVIPSLKFIKGDMFSDKHWMEMLDMLGIPNKSVESLKFQDFLLVRENIEANLDMLKDLNARAASEIVIRQALNELDVWEIEAKFTMFEHIDSQRKHLLLVQDYKDILNKVGDNQCLLQSIKSSPNFDSFADQASIWENRLATLDESLRNLTQIQRKWLYLEPIFGVGTLAHDKARFHRVDVDFRNIASDMARDRRVISLCKKSGLSQMLHKLLDQLGRCQKSLNDFLEEKRSSFPRFYFIGDDDLLEILGQSTKEKVVQAHLKKLFAGIHSVDFDASGQRIIAIKSLDGEVVPLSRPITVTQNVEQWLSQLVEEMRSTLKKLLVQCLEESRRSQVGPDPLTYPSQVLCLAESILFTERCEAAIKGGKLHTLLASLKSQLESYTSQEVQGGEDSSDVLELKLRALILDTIHHMIMVEGLIVCQSLNVESWAWQKQLRFYLLPDGSAVARMVDAEFSYTYEYLGNTPKLVHTPLTDKCYLTLTQAMHMGLGGNPLGPAGTGKTESVKALGGLLGRQVLVFNCDEGIDVTSMARIFVGLVKCGAWGCFDEFNRLEEATLSAISMQIQPIQAALRGRHQTVTLMETEVMLDPNAGIFVTMNPAGKGYGGRQRLPDNLKQLFRPVVMAQPDNEQIASVLLHTEGFRHAADLGAKLVEVFNLAKCLLSTQQHYDWGLRALKTVLKGCGSALRSVRRTGQMQLNAETEAELAVRALRLNTLSKLTSADSERLDALLLDIFPGIKLTESSDEHLVSALSASCRQLQLEENPTQIKKCLELYEQLQQRMGVVIVGPTGSGKTTLCRMLRQALNSQGHIVRQYTINPKAMLRSQLLGYVDQDTRQWQDGVLTMSAQQVHAEPPEVTSWVVCDGDIDPEWVESLNSVLDDNRLLTLPSGWRIQFGPNVNFLFETHDLSQASPATISRMGMILLSEEDVNIKHLVKVWLKQQATEENIAQLFEEHFFKAVAWIQSNGELVVPWSLVGIVRTGLSQMHGVTSTSHFTCALIRGLGTNLSKTSRQAFAEKVLEWTGEFLHDSNRILNCYYDERRDCLDTYSTDELEIIPEGEGNRLVLTSNVKSILGHLEAWFQDNNKYPFLLVGPQGCGKSTILKYCFNHLRSTEVAEIHCSAQITPQHVLQKLSQVTMSISSNTGRVLRPKNTEHLVLYFRDLNLAKPDKWGTSMLIAFLQQIFTYRGFYDQSLEWVGVEGIQIIGSMTTSSSSGRHDLSPRFTSLVAIHACSYPDNTTLRNIYGSILYHTLAPTLPQFSQLKSSGKLLTLIDTMIKVYSEISSEFTPLQHNHYIFTPYFLTQWCQGLARYSFDNNKDLVESLLQVVVHECQRLFRDMLVTTEDKEKFDSILSSILEEAWNRSMSGIITKLADSFYVSVGATGKKNDIYPQGKPLGPLSKNDWTTIVERTLAQYGREQQPLGLLLIPELLRGMAIVDRILSCPYGSLLLAGRAGAGRKSSIRLAATLHGARLFTLSMASGYSIKHFKKDLKAAMQVAGVEMEQVYLLVEDHQLVEPNFLDMLNSLLSAGEVPGLYANDELEPLVSPLKDMAAQEGFAGSPAAFFAERVKQNLHLILVMDCTDSNFIQNCESNPALYKHCSIQWWETWDKESMLKIPQLLLQKIEEGDDSLLENESVADKLISHLMTIHSKAPHFLLSPRRYVAFVHLYKHILSFKQKNIKERQGRLKAGVGKLTEARNVVAELRTQAKEQEKQLAEKQAEAATALHLISETMQGANTQKSEMETLKDQTLKENEELLKRKKAIDIELKEVEPLVQEAQAAVGNIKTEALSEIRSLRAPPDVIRDILEGVLRLMGTQDTSWNSMKTFLAKRGVKEDIRSFNARNINPESRQAVEKLLRDKKESFDPKNAKRASVAAAPLASWVTANVKYSVVLEKIRPLEREQNKLHKNLKSAEDHIGQLSTDLSDVSARVAELKERLNTYTKEGAEIEIHLNKAKDTLQAAETLVGKLNEEYERWRIQLTELSGDLNELPLQALLAAAFISYLPGVAEEQRRALLIEWQQNLGLVDFSLARFLASEQQLLQWQSEGLPSDQVSIENAVVILQTGLRPLLVDPSSQACEWLKKHLHDRPVEVVAQSNERFTTLLELAVRFGKVLIIPEVDQINPILLPLLRGDFTSQGARCVVHIGEKMIDYHKDFQLFLVSRNISPDISPSAASVISLVNFATTPAGLGAQLLSSALHHDKPELETKRGDLLREEERLRARLQQLQENLLLELASAQGDVLQNKELLASLNETKASSAAIGASLVESSRLQEALGSERELYRPLSEFASLLFFATQDLTRANATYQFSVAAFTRLFQSSLHVSQADETTEARISTVKRYLIRFVYDYVGRSLFKADRLMFAIHLVHKMYPHIIPQNEWEVFTGQAIPDPSASKVPVWISEERSNAVRLLESALPTLYGSLQLSEKTIWSEFADSGECELHIPTHLSKLTDFQCVLVVQALRPDRLHSMLNIFAQKSLGLHDLSPSALSLKKVLSETQATEPILLIALNGADPSEEIKILASSTVGDQAFREVALGQGQVELAERLLQEASQNGHWLCLKNLHLVCKWIPVLESLLRSLQPHKDFRLWLTSQPHSSLSAVLLQSCLKITYEAPQGIKRNLQRTYTGWGRELIEVPGHQSVLRVQVLFALAWLHAILQERGTYIPQGWSHGYEFSDSDLRSAVLILEPLVITGRIKWEYIYGLYETAIYGGRIDNTFDLRVLSVYLREYFNNAALTGVKSFGPGITLPTSVKFTESLNVISQLPDQDKPELFGLPANIDRSWQRLTSQRVIHQLLVLSRPENGSIKLDLSKWESHLTPIFNLWKKLNQSSGLVQVKLPTEMSKSEEKPIQQFCALEWHSAVNLTQKVHRSLASLLRVVKGTTLPNNDAIELAEAIMQHQTPDAWLQMWEGPLDPLLFVRNVVSRALAVQGWMQKSIQGQLLQENLNLSELFHPDTFLSALKQQTAREYHLAMSELHLVSSWSSVIPSARLPVQVCGLHLEGATFKSGSLSAANPDSPSVELLPPCILAWIPKLEKSSNKSIVELPVYQSVNRKKLVTSLELPCTGEKAKWMLASVALFLEI